MNDVVGQKLQSMRIKEVLPLVKGRLLDVGCGSNALVKEYRKTRNEGVGVDVFDWGNVDFLVDNTAKLPFLDGEFDTATIIAALNHIPNRNEVLDEVNRILKPGGYLVMTMLPPVLSMVWHKLREPWDEDQHERGMKEGEVFGITRRDMIGLAEKTGFTLIQDRGFMFGLNRIYLFQKS